MDFAVVLGLVFFAIACALGIVVATVRFYRSFQAPRVPAVPSPSDTVSDPSLVAQVRIEELESEMSRRRESHEEVVRVLIKERDSWRNLHELLSGQFSETEAWYANKLEEYAVFCNRAMSKADEDERKKMRERLAAHRALKSLPRTDVKKEEGVSVIDGEGAPDPDAAFKERMA